MALLSILATCGNGCDHHTWQFLGMTKSFFMHGNALCLALCSVLPWEKLHGAMLKIPCVCEVINGLYCMHHFNLVNALFHFIVIIIALSTCTLIVTHAAHEHMI